VPKAAPSGWRQRAPVDRLHRRLDQRLHLVRRDHAHLLVDAPVEQDGDVDRLDEAFLFERSMEGILAFAERILPRAADFWVQASLEQRQRFQQLFVPDGIAFDGNGFVGTAVTAPAFNYLRPIETGNEGLVDLNSASWNQVGRCLRTIQALWLAA
jgi:hypothetical protein